MPYFIFMAANRHVKEILGVVNCRNDYFKYNFKRKVCGE